jgi:hypothetical protein
MKLFVLTDKRGKVTGTARMTESQYADTPFGGCPMADEEHRVHEITLPPELHHIRSADELHREVSKLIKTSTT